jgi:hypothetical protein
MKSSGSVLGFPVSKIGRPSEDETPLAVGLSPYQ